MVLSRVCKNCSPVARRKQKQREDVKEEAAGPLINKAGGGREEGGAAVFSCSAGGVAAALWLHLRLHQEDTQGTRVRNNNDDQINQVTKTAMPCLTFFLPKGGSLQRASRLLRPWWAQVLARSRLTWRGEEEGKGGEGRRCEMLRCDATSNRFSLICCLIL